LDNLQFHDRNFGDQGHNQSAKIYEGKHGLRELPDIAVPGKHLFWNKYTRNFMTANAEALQRAIPLFLEQTNVFTADESSVFNPASGQQHADALHGTSHWQTLENIFTPRIPFQHPFDLHRWVNFGWNYAIRNPQHTLMNSHERAISSYQPPAPKKRFSLW
tara:strand:- start:2115 stop:2597 length:483 start_codon:yes stop_codon:yes gene_type:complete